MAKFERYHLWSTLKSFLEKTSDNGEWLFWILSKVLLIFLRRKNQRRIQIFKIKKNISSDFIGRRKNLPKSLLNVFVRVNTIINYFIRKLPQVIDWVFIRMTLYNCNGVPKLAKCQSYKPLNTVHNCRISVFSIISLSA
jgi:hypothetical protein